MPRPSAVRPPASIRQTALVRFTKPAAEAESAHLVVVTREVDRAAGQALAQQRDELAHVASGFACRESRYGLRTA